MPITDTWQEWSTTAASNPPAGTAVPLMDDEIRNVKAELIKNAVALSGDQTIAGTKTFSTAPELPGGTAATVVNVAAYFASGTKLPFFQAAAPTGWTQDTGVNDKVLRVVSGAGGGNGGNWTLSGMSVDNHTLVIDEIPSHSHTAFGGAGAFVGTVPVVIYTGSGLNTGETGGGGGHNHGLTNSSWRPAYIDMIICAKD